jgi:hypothetical protein
MSKQKNVEFDPVKSFLDTRRNYELMPWLSLGATDSAHQVFFAANGKGPVAVKAYTGDKAVARAEHEKRMLHIIKGLGFLTLSPVGIEVNRDGGAAFLLTKYVPNLRSMSSVVQDRSGEVQKQVQRTAATLGALHGLGVSHGDSQIKNFIIDPREKKRILVPDPEKGGTEVIGHFKLNPYQHDLDSLVQSLAYKRYGGRNPNMAGDKIIEDVIEPYVHSAEQAGARHFDPHAIGETGLLTFLDKHTDLHTSRR